LNFGQHRGPHRGSGSALPAPSARPAGRRGVGTPAPGRRGHRAGRLETAPRKTTKP